MSKAIGTTICLLGVFLCLQPAALFSQANVTDALQETLPKGWECLQGPNELDRPGRTFYIDRSGVRYELADLYGRLKPISGEVSSVVARANGQVSAGLFARLLGFGDVSVSGSRSYATAVALLQRQEVRTEEADARAALRTVDPTLIDPNYTYYIIRNIQLARQMRLTIDKGVAAAFGGEVNFRRLVQVSGGKGTGSPAPSSGPGSTGGTPIISADEGSSFTIDQIFDKPLTVCYLAQKFTLKNVAGGAGGTIRDAQLVEKYWNPSGTE